MHKHNAPKINIPICVAAVLFCLTLFSIHFMSGFYAKYTSRASGEDSARVIKFGELTLTETGDFASGTAFIIPGVDLTKKAVVSFGGSESATYVFVKIDLSSNWENSGNTFSIDDKLSWSVADGWSYLDGSKYVYYRELSPNDTLTADVIAENGKITVSDEITKAEIGSLTGIKIDITGYVVQLNGFASPSEAWASVSAKS